METQQIYKFLRYSLQFIIIYLVLKYIPQLKIGTVTALSLALLLTTLCVVLEFVYGKIINKQNEYLEGDCNTCAGPPPVSTCNNVCGSAEPFTLTNHNPHNDHVEKLQDTQVHGAISTQPIVPVHVTTQPVVQPAIQPKMETIAQPMITTQENYPTGGTTMDVPPFYLAKIGAGDEKQEVLNHNSNMERDRALEKSGYQIDENATPYQVPGKKSETRKAQHYDARVDGDIVNEMDYSDFDFNSLPVARGYRSSAADYGYNFLPPEAWTAQPVRAPVCVTTTREPVMPMWANGSPVDVKDFYIASKITGPLGLSTAYVNDKLNAGR